MYCVCIPQQYMIRIISIEYVFIIQNFYNHHYIGLYQSCPRLQSICSNLYLGLVTPPISTTGLQNICPTKALGLVTQPTKGSIVFFQPRLLGLVTQTKLFQGFHSIFSTRAPGTNNSTHIHKEHEHQSENKRENPQNHGYPRNDKARKNQCQSRKSSVSMTDLNKITTCIDLVFQNQQGNHTYNSVIAKQTHCRC